MSELMKREASHSPAVHVPSQSIWLDEYLDNKQSDFKIYYRILRKRLWMIVSVVAIALAATSVWTYTTKPKFKSTVRIQIDPDQTILPYKDMYESITADPRYVETQAEVLQSEVLARRVVTRLDLTADPARLARIAAGFAANLEVLPLINTQVVKVTYTAEDPQFAARAINMLADEYVDYSFESKREATTSARDFLGKELLTLKQKLEASEAALVTYAREHSMFLAQADKDNVVFQKLGDLNKEMTTVEARLLANQYQMIKNATPATFPESMKTLAMKDLESRRSTLEEKLANTRMRFGPRWPEVVTLTEEVADVRRQIAAETKRAVEQAKLEYDLAQAHRRRLAAAVDEQNQLAGRMTQDSVQYNILKREVETDRQLHDGVLQRVKEASVSAGLKAANIHIIDRGQVPVKAYSPNVPLNLALGLTIGLVFGIMLACFAEFVRGTIAGAEDVEQSLRLPMLATIPPFEKSWTEATGGILVGAVGDLKPRRLAAYVNDTAQRYWEHYRSLRTSLLFSSADKCPQTILVTSAVMGEGKSTTVVNLGIALAQTGARTLVLDLDLRKPRLASFFNASGSQGISRYLSGQSELNTEIQETGIPNLFLIAAGPIPPNPPELIGSARMTFGLQLLSQYFDHILIDAPPLMPVTDALVIARVVDGVLMVVEGGKTPTAIVEKARNLLGSVDARVLGVIINKADVADSKYGYGYYQEFHAAAEHN